MKRHALTVFIVFIAATFCAAQNSSSDTFSLDKRAMTYLQTKAQNLDFKTCDEKVIVEYISKYFEKDKYDRYNEFDKRKYINLVRDTLDKSQKEYSFDDIYAYKSTRLLGDYDFNKKRYPLVGHYYMNGGQFAYTSYKNETQVIQAHSIQGVNLVNENEFPLYLSFNEDEAEKILLIKKQMRREYLDSLYSTMDESSKIFNQRKGVKFKDDFGNFGDNEDRRVYFLYYMRVLDPAQSKGTKKKAAKFINSLVNPSGSQKVEEDENQLKAEIVKVEVYLKGGVPATVKNLYVFYPNQQQKLFTIK